MEVTSQMKEIAILLAKINGGRPRMQRFYDDNKKSAIDLVIMDNKPNQAETTYATVGLSNYTIGKSVDNKPLRVEIISACASEYDYFANIIGTCAFNIINSGYKCYPGALFPDVVKMYNEDLKMKHIMFVDTFLWDDSLKTLTFDDKIVVWLKAIPISEAEYAYAQEHGSDALGDLLEQSDIDILDLERESVI